MPARWEIPALALIILSGNLAGAALALLWLIITRTDWQRVGFRAPRQWTVSLAVALLGGSTLKLVMKTLVMPLLGAPATNAAYAYLIGNTAALPAMFFVVIIGAGFGEELIWRGLLFDRVRQFVGWTSPVKLATVMLTASLFGAVHLRDQGLAGAEQAFITGLVFGGVYVRTACLWPIMVAHAAFDATAVLIIYFDVERVLAHLFVG